MGSPASAFSKPRSSSAPVSGRKPGSPARITKVRTRPEKTSQGGTSSSGIPSGQSSRPPPTNTPSILMASGQSKVTGRSGGAWTESAAASAFKIGRAHVRTPVTNAQLVCRLLLEKKKQIYPRTCKYHQNERQTSHKKKQ